jgi:hypothetical protein
MPATEAFTRDYSCKEKKEKKRENEKRKERKKLNLATEIANVPHPCPICRLDGRDHSKAIQLKNP